MTKAEREAARRLQRKLEGLCEKCGAGLQEDDGVLCVECVAEQRAYAVSPAGRRVARDAQARWRERNLVAVRETDATAKAELYAQRLADGVCVECDGPRDNGTLRCDANGCRPRAQARWQRYRDRRAEARTS